MLSKCFVVYLPGPVVTKRRIFENKVCLYDQKYDYNLDTIINARNLIKISVK